MRSDRDGIAWTPRCLSGYARKRDDEGHGAHKEAGARGPLRTASPSWADQPRAPAQTASWNQHAPDPGISITIGCCAAPISRSDAPIGARTPVVVQFALAIPI